MTRKNIQSLLLFKIRAFIYIALSITNPLLRPFFKQQMFILCYHSVASDTWRYGVTLSMLEKQLTYLSLHYQPITLEDVQQVIEGKKKITTPSFVITFDDGYKEIMQTCGIMKKLGITPTFFILSDTKQANYTELDTKRPFVTQKDITTLLKDGWTLGSHGATHADFWNLSSASITKEVISSRKILQKTYKEKVAYFAYPKGRYTPTVLRALKSAGYVMGLSMNDGFISPSTDMALVPRIGVDRTHTFVEFKRLMLPSSILFRAVIKKLHIGGLIG